MSSCNCYMAQYEGHDYSCKNHPRRKRNRLTDTQRLNAVIKWAKDAMTDPESSKKLWAADLQSRKHIDKAIKELI